MMNLPHLSFLRSFEAAARHLSFTSAAEELNCTQAAVSNHVRSLEDFLRRPLFVRHPRSLSLTDVGTAYLQSVRHALQEIDLATQSLTLQVHKREVVVSCPVSLAESWLAEVIGSFRRVHPDIDLTVHGTVWNDVETNVSDISIIVSHVDDTPADLHLLWEETLTLVCAPDYRPDGELLTRPDQLHHADLIHILGRPIYWGLAEEALGLKGLNLKGGLRTSGPSLALELAVQGLGCIMLPRSVVQRYLERGLLIEPFDLQIKSPWCYFTRCNEKTATPSVKAFFAWMLKAAEAA
ncbi:transcriptional regulator, LysR family protein [Roseobacter sp. SK209-2-6]|uniref:LysR substrate-binding domain-containing protein n=1 Tax=Roseobacter sp. SK209-2-6 TaxID=388739 RepID=UPI0000F3D74B|nr:LysR substrate-binding domain-containing protein [Roseobacter sp. SK209-2-6]EBA17336.1 transcriptional regulator, LysR family protein [Roseobacter sp. SK209-2-6]